MISRVLHVDDTVFWSPDDFKIDHVISGLKKLNFELTYKGYADSFLGIKLGATTVDNTTILQPALIETNIETLDL